MKRGFLSITFLMFLATVLFAQEKTFSLPPNIQNSEPGLDKALQLMTAFSKNNEYSEEDIKVLVYYIGSDNHITLAEKEVLKAFKTNNVPFYVTNLESKLYMRVDKKLDSNAINFVNFMMNRLKTKDPNQVVGNYLFFQQHQRFFNYFIKNEYLQPQLKAQLEDYIGYLCEHSDKQEWDFLGKELENMVRRFYMDDISSYQKCKSLIYDVCDAVNKSKNYNIPVQQYNWVLNK